MPKRLLVCCDGTWNRPDQITEAPVAGGATIEVPAPTNVAKLAFAVSPTDAAGVEQCTWYNRGVGTTRGERLRGGAFGLGLAANVRDTYRFLVDCYEPGDELYFLGFSRGAFTARSVAGFIRNAGILRPERAHRLADAYTLYRSRSAHPVSTEATLFRKSYSYETRIEFIGVWDTVCALGIPLNGFRWINRRNRFHDVALSSTVDAAFHALAVDERHRPFRPAVWSTPTSDTQVFEQVWFTGVHCDVGGGNAGHGLSDIALNWMVARAGEHGLAVDHDVLAQGQWDARFGGQGVHPDPLAKAGTSYTSFYRLTRPWRRPIGAASPASESAPSSAARRRKRDEHYPRPNPDRYLAGSAVLGLEQFPLGHSRGASQDHSRIIRLAQHQDAYADLAPDAYDAWHTVERASGVQLLTRTGGLVIEDVAARDPAATGTRNIAGYDDVLRRHGVDFERLDADEIVRRWPQFRLAGSEQGIYQAESGIVDAGNANATHVALARAAGATIRDQTPVLHVRPRGQHVEVVTAEETYLAEKVVIAADAWTNTVLADLGRQLPLTVTQEQVTYYATPHLLDFSPARFPVFMWHGRHNFYGFPVYGEVATKLGQHNGGFTTTADTRTFTPDPVREQRQLDFLAEHLPRFAGPTLYTKTCLYTLPPDQHFVLDTLPEHPNVAVAVGAGHAYKFASLIGQVLTDLALRGKSSYPIEHFRLDRPALTDPSFRPSVHV